MNNSKLATNPIIHQNFPALGVHCDYQADGFDSEWDLAVNVSERTVPFGLKVTAVQC